MSSIRTAAVAILLASVSGLALAQSPAPDPAAPAATPAPSAPAAPSATPSAPSATPAAPAAPDATIGARAPSDRPVSSLSAPLPSPNDAAKFNPKADADDKKPTMAHALALTDEQRRQLSGLLAGKAQPQGQAAGQRSEFKPEVAARMPASAKVNDLPDEVTGPMPTLKPYKYAVVDDKILLVDPVNGYMIVEILNR